MEKTEANKEEIDLLDLLVRIFSAFAKNLILTIVLPLAGMILVYTFTRASFERIQSEMMVVTDLLSATECEFIMGQFQKTDSIPGMTSTERRSVSGLSFKVTPDPDYKMSYSNIKSYDVQSRPPVYLKVTASVSDCAVLIPLQRGLVNYLNNSKPVLAERTQRKIHYEELIRKIDQELADLEKAKTAVGGSASLDPAGLFTGAVNLYEKKVSYELSMKESQSVQVVHEFTSTTNMNNQLPASHALVIGFVIGFGVLVIVLFLKFFFRYYRQQQKNQLV